jgi:phage protein U
MFSYRDGRKVNCPEQSITRSVGQDNIYISGVLLPSITNEDWSVLFFIA